MTDRVNGGVAGGEFLSGKMDFFAIGTSLLLDATGVNTPVQDLYQINSNVWTPVTVNGVTYATKADYIAAWKKQQNLNKVVNAFSLRANPVIVSASSGAVNLATEKTGLWFVDGQGNYGEPANDTNYLGYLVETVLADMFLWAAGDNVETGAPSAQMTFGGGGNSAVTRSTSL